MNSNNGKKVVVGMSGGVDSSVAAYILKKQGYEVIGLFMKNWDETDENGVCQATEDYEDVARVCDQLDIPHYSVEFIKEYNEMVFQDFVKEYNQGYTPNPDVLCNREIKFNVFFNHAMSLGADFLATGHYCRVEEVNGRRRLLKGNDPGKDQTYFLNAISEESLKKVLFPIGDLPKSEVRKIASELSLATKDKKDSTGICFIGERNFKNFLSNYIKGQKGEFRNLENEVVGEHTGFQFYTIGQRKGLGLGGPGEPWFVVAKDTQLNIVYVERGTKHPSLFADNLTANEISWIAGKFEHQLPYRCKAKIRYRQSDQDCVITKIDSGILTVEFDQPQRAITPRQSIVFYDGDLCLGGAMIIKSGPSYYEQKKELPQIISV